jgi:hypothetical protein
MPCEHLPLFHLVKAFETIDSLFFGRWYPLFPYLLHRLRFLAPAVFAEAKFPETSFLIQ